MADAEKKKCTCGSDWYGGSSKHAEAYPVLGCSLLRASFVVVRWLRLDHATSLHLCYPMAAPRTQRLRRQLRRQLHVRLLRRAQWRQVHLRRRLVRVPQVQPRSVLAGHAGAHRLTSCFTRPSACGGNCGDNCTCGCCGSASSGTCSCGADCPECHGKCEGKCTCSRAQAACGCAGGGVRTPGCTCAPQCCKEGACGCGWYVHDY